MRSLYENKLIAAAENALLEARLQLRRFWLGRLALEPMRKGNTLDWSMWQGEPTDADRECENILFSALSKLPFEFSLVSEDGGQRRNGGSVAFLVDPLDGSHNAWAGYPAFTASVAMYHQEHYVFGWVYDISRDVIYSAAVGQGAFLQTSLAVERLSTRKVQESKELAISFLRPNGDLHRDTLGRLLWEARKIRLSSCSSLDLCLISSGVLDAFIDVSHPGHERSCDIAAAATILQEAGGAVLASNGHPRRIDAPSLHGTCDFSGLIAAGSIELAQSLSGKFPRRMCHDADH